MDKSHVVIGPTGGEDQNEKVGDLTHGGFRSNRHHQAVENLADERGMGRDLLKQTGSLYPESMMEEGHAEMMKAWGAGGQKDNSKTSKWSKGT